MLHHKIRHKVHQIRQKPQHVREGILLAVMAVAAPLLLTFWFSTFQFKTNSQDVGDVKQAASNLTESFK